MRFDKKETWKITTASVHVEPEGNTMRWTVRYEYPDRRSLWAVGPACFVNWCISDELEDALVAASQPVPKPVVAHALIDTGAMEC